MVSAVGELNQLSNGGLTFPTVFILCDTFTTV